VLVSQTTRELLRDDPLPDVSLRDLGEHQLKDLDEPERIYQLVAPGLDEEFPPLKTSAPVPFEGREGELVEAAQETVRRDDSTVAEESPAARRRRRRRGRRARRSAGHRPDTGRHRRRIGRGRPERRRLDRC